MCSSCKCFCKRNNYHLTWEQLVLQRGTIYCLKKEEQLVLWNNSVFYLSNKWGTSCPTLFQVTNCSCCNQEQVDQCCSFLIEGTFSSQLDVPVNKSVLKIRDEFTVSHQTFKHYKFVTHKNTVNRVNKINICTHF